MDIADNIARLRSQLPEGVSLVAVSKTKPAEAVIEALAAGQTIFGENYATELRDKHASLPVEARWHFVGHLQAKQLKYYIGFVELIHGVDSWQHLSDVDSAARKTGRTVDVLLQLHVAQEETKFGFAPSELDDEEAWRGVANMEGVRIRGVMGMASHTDDTARVRADFRAVRQTFDRLKVGQMGENATFDTVSMGMSHDWRVAVDEGSTMVRIGSEIFGARTYPATR